MADVSIKPPTTPQNSGLARALLQAQRLTSAQIEPILKKSLAEKTPFIDTLLLKNFTIVNTTVL